MRKGLGKRLFRHPLIQRVVWHLKRIGKNLDPHFFAALLGGLVVVVSVAALAVMLIEKDRTFTTFGETFYWAVTTVMGQGDASHVTTWGGWLVSWLLVLFGVGIVATITGALLGFVIDFLLKEGQGMGASGYQDHIVICGWNSTARELVEELRSDDYNHQVVILHDAERNPSEGDVYFVRGDTTRADDLKRAGIEHALAAIICPSDASNESDMRSILVVLAIESIAKRVRTVVEVNNPHHADHFKRASVDELLITSKLSAHLLARTSLYPGLSDLVTDLVTGARGLSCIASVYQMSTSASPSTSCLRGCGPITPRRCWRSAGMARRTSTRRRASRSRREMTRWSWPSRWEPSHRCRTSLRWIPHADGPDRDWTNWEQGYAWVIR